ncbi:hypothetical protein [Geminicoccus roseus]|uniref:hypothetical protein n=1 Tax=Geminicoccus roseus TaxID=404900 RepID=UPI00146FB49D|nr:hypothetical protein [Geminicoccus roseus]
MAHAANAIASGPEAVAVDERRAIPSPDDGASFFDLDRAFWAIGGAIPCCMIRARRPCRDHVVEGLKAAAADPDEAAGAARISETMGNGGIDAPPGLDPEAQWYRWGGHAGGSLGGRRPGMADPALRRAW